MKFLIHFLLTLFVLAFLFSCANDSGKSAMNEVQKEQEIEARMDSFMDVHDLDLEEFQTLYFYVENDSTPYNYDSLFYNAYANDEIEKSGDFFIDTFLDSEYTSEEGNSLMALKSLVNDFNSEFSLSEKKLMDLESTDFLERPRKRLGYFVLKGQRYYPKADLHLESGFRKRLNSMTISSPRPLLDSILENRYPKKLLFKDTLVDLEISTKGIEAFNVPYFNGYQLLLNNNYFHDSLIIIPDTAIFFCDAYLKEGETHYEINFKINSKTIPKKKEISKREQRIVFKIPMTDFFK